MTPPTRYETDVVAWAKEQADLIRAGRLDALDLEHIAEEIADVGKSEQRELANRMTLLLAHLLKWQFQPELRGASWTRTIRVQRDSIARRLLKSPGLKASLTDPDWWADAWGDAVAAAARETGTDAFPDDCPWAITDVLDHNWLPDQAPNNNAPRA